MKILMQPTRVCLTGLLALLASATLQIASAEDTVLLRDGAIVVTDQDVQQELLLFSETERDAITTDPEALKGLLRRIYLGKRLVAEAGQAGLDQDPTVQARLAAEQRRVLSDALREHARQQIEYPDFAALARQHYAARPDEFQLPEQFKAAHILKKVQCACEKAEQRQRIDALLAQLKAGADFAELAKAQSDDTGSAAQGGDLGRWLKREDLVAPFANALAPLQIGELSNVVETEYGFHIIKKLDEQPARRQTFDEVRESLEQRLRQNYAKDQLQQQALSYMPGPEAQFNEPALQALLKSP
jgi:peptidyl-prolyl cis-trans isomerase C